MEQPTYSDRITICAYNTMFFNDIAHSSAFDLMAYMKKSPIYRHEIKRVVNTLEKELKKYTSLMKRLSTTKDGLFYADICDNMADFIGDDVLKLEYSIKNALDKEKIENSSILAKIETARCLAWGACINLDMRERNIRKEIPVDLSEMRPIAKLIERLSSILYEHKTRTVDFNQDQNCLLAFRIIQKKLLNGHKIADCINRAAGEEEFIISEETPPGKTPNTANHPNQSYQHRFTE